MYKWGLLFALLACVMHGTAFAQLERSVSPTPNETGISGEDKAGNHVSVNCYPQALPNDGVSESEITVVVSEDGIPLAGTVVTGEVTRSDGSLLYAEATTNADGQTTFTYTAGIMPEPGAVEFSVPELELTVETTIPLAPVTYLDVTMVTPDEYAEYLKRQASAAPIYRLYVEAFPLQLAADGGSMSTISVQLSHVANDTPASGVPLEMEIISGEGELEIESPVTDKDGRLSFNYVAEYTPGTVTIQVIEPSTGLVEAVDLLLVEAGPARIDLQYIDPRTDALSRDGALLPADGMTPLELVARVTDLNGVPLSGVELVIECMEEGGGWIEVIDPVSDIEGLVPIVYHAGTTVGQIRLRAYAAAGLDFAAAGYPDTDAPVTVRTKSPAI